MERRTYDGQGYTSVTFTTTLTIEGSFDEDRLRKDVTDAMQYVAKRFDVQDVAIEMRMPIYFWTALGDGEEDEPSFSGYTRMEAPDEA